MKKCHKFLISIVTIVFVFTLTGCQNRKTTSTSSSSNSVAKEKKSHSKKASKKNRHKPTEKSKAKELKEKTKNAVEKSSQPVSKEKGTSSTSVSNAASTSSQQSASVKKSSQATTNSHNPNPVKNPVSSATQPQNSTAKGVWSTAKNQELSKFMASWQTKMRQSYQGTYDGKNPNHYGFIFPKSFSDAHFKDKIRINNQPVALSWWAAANSAQSTYRVVAVATDPRPDKLMQLITYFFIDHQGKPEVYYSMTTNGGILYLFPTENIELKQGFAQIFNQ